MALNHGINTFKDESNFVTTKRNDASSIPFYIGAWPCHTAGGYTGKPQLANTFAEVKTLGGYSDAWRDANGNPKWNLCQAAYAHFNVFGMSPAVFYNVFDPTTHKTAVASAAVTVTDHCAKLPDDAIIDSGLTVSAGQTSLTKDTDYTAFYDGGYLVIELKSTSASYSATSLTIGYNAANPGAITAADISAAIEKIELCMGELGIVPDLICAPGWSKTPAVAAVMAVKAANVNGLMKGKAVVDIDTAAAAADTYDDVANYKAANGYTDENMIVCWPLAKIGDKVYDMSVIWCGAAATVDYGTGVPSEGVSNKTVPLSGITNAAGEEINLTVYQADALSITAGVVTALNYNGWRLWGNYTGCSDKTDAAKAFITCNRMHDFLCNSFVKMFWEYLDRPLSRMLIDAIVNRYNAFLAGLAQAGAIYGGEIAYIADNNATADLIAGMFCLNAKFASPVPAQRIDMHAEYDIEMLMSSINV